MAVNFEVRIALTVLA